MNVVQPALHPAISAQLYEKLEVSDAEIENCKSVRNEMRASVNSLLKVMIFHNYEQFVKWLHYTVLVCRGKKLILYF